ncbi:MAG: mercury methylation corrinoid protein HgcA [candidate division WOR-3 bacterium]|nr:mercury methylation corrinoid protein HgcA [candidate division WOR-3 bacterium]
MIKPTTSNITLSDKLQHFFARVGLRRNRFRVQPGLYTLGKPNKESHVFVTANYGLSFNKLREALAGVDCYILVLDTKGINVWCAAGKGTFGTEELIHRIKDVELEQYVSHRLLILPQLGASGVAAHETEKRTGFKVEYGPVRADDIPAYLETHKATPQMRLVRFDLSDRLTLVPVELTHMILPTALLVAILYYVSGPIPALAALVIIVTGLMIFPIVIPWIPTPNFSTKGFILGGIVALPFFLIVLLTNPMAAWWKSIGWAFPYLLVMPSLVAFITLNYTGATPFTSKSGVAREIFSYFPIMFWMFCAGAIIGLVFRFVR